MNDAVHIFQGDGYAGAVMVFQHRDIDQYVAALRQNLRQPAANTAMRDQLWFVIDTIGAEALHTVPACRYMESSVFQFVAVAVPDHDVVRLDSGLLQPLANGFDERVAAESASSQCIHFQAHRFTRPDQLVPCFDGIIAVEKSLHGAIQEAQHSARIHRGARSAQHGIARDYDPGFRERGSLFCSCEQSHPAACAQNRSPSKTLLTKIPPAGAAHCSHKASPGEPTTGSEDPQAT